MKAVTGVAAFLFLTMILDKYKYHVAISLRSQDNAIGDAIRDQLADRFETFIYTKNYKEIEGTDGVAKFAEVFGGEALLNVILYRKGWGERGYTAVEANAIKIRGVDGDGWEHLLVVTLDEWDLPKWIPKNLIYSDFEKRGLDGVVSVIEYRIQTLGGEVREETLEDLAARKLREKKLLEEIGEYMQSAKALKDAKSEVARMFESCLEKWNGIEALGLKNIKKGERNVCVSFGGWRLRFVWSGGSQNSPRGWKMTAYIEKYMPYSENDYKTLIKTEYSFAMNRIKEIGWKEDQEQEDVISSDRLIDDWTKDLIEMPPIDYDEPY